MKKSELIKLLSALDGDPEILLWSDLAEDWQDIKSKQAVTQQCKPTLSHYLEDCTRRLREEHKDWDYALTEKEHEECVEGYSEHEWSDSFYGPDEDYITRNVVYLEPRLRHKTTFDRLGTISY